MKFGERPGNQDERRRPVRGRAFWFAILACLTAFVLGPVAALAAAGKPADSGGAGLITTSQNGATLTVGTTTLVATQPATTTTTATTVVNGTTTTAAVTSTTPSCTEPAVGTVTTTVSAAPTTAITTPTSTSCVVAAPTTLNAGTSAAISKRGMWIWELPATDHGNVAAIIAQAKHYGIGTVYVKSGDGNAVWSQFTPALVDAFHAAGLKVCAWQFVYGNTPIAEAKVGIESVQDGADCLVIDAESQYQRKYVQAQQYITTLRAGIGANYPVALAGFPYVDYHPTFPYSVFLGPGGAQFNLPQMYWKDIGTTPDAVYAHTYEFNELYQRPIFPLGQLYDSPTTAQVKKFRSIGYAYKTTGVSWWDWQSAGTSQFSAISVPTGAIKGYRANTTVASLGKGAIGDLVVLAQEHLANTLEPVAIDGDFGPATLAAVKKFQRLNQLPVSGVITPQTWLKLLKVKLPSITWAVQGKSVVAKVGVTPTATTTVSATAPAVSTTTAASATTTPVDGGGLIKKPR